MSKPGQKYEPPNGITGSGFQDHYCLNCVKDFHFWNYEKDGCEIVLRSFEGPVEEWVYGKDGVPVCTAFVPLIRLVEDRKKRAEKAHKTRQENEYNDPRQLRLF